MAPVSEEKVRAVINRGGSPPILPDEAGVSFKAVNVKLTAGELATIRQLREQRPRSGRTRKITISVHDWIVEAVQEKIEREKRRYGL
ncbi:hypothetical protein [Larkinella soli]|uniref:hypothetical protein n=1 Tax=Larkinella soli TaxID=1770527 RepID=UPI000FFC5376|nr:hypothetical protein [Larkinella soli]